MNCAHCNAPMVKGLPTPRGEAPLPGVYIAGKDVRPAWMAGRRLMVEDPGFLDDLAEWRLTCCRKAGGECVGVRVRRRGQIVDEVVTWWDAVPAMQARRREVVATREAEAGVKRAKGERCFVACPPQPGWRWDRCVAETQDESTDECRGCEGWGVDCWAVWAPVQGIPHG